MSILRKLKSLFSTSEEAENTVSAAETEEEEPHEEPAVDEAALEKARKSEEALLEALSALHIVKCDTQATSFMQMHSYSFEKPFDSRDLRNLVSGLRWLGFRLHAFSVQVNGSEIDCESWQTFGRHLAESPVEAVNLVTSFGGVRVNTTIAAGGSVHFSHDSSRGVDFSPFEGIFDPEEVE